MRRNKIWILGSFLLVLGIVSWQSLYTSPSARFQHKYGLGTTSGTIGNVSDGNVLTQKSLLVSNGIVMSPEASLSTQEASQEPTRENGWVVANTRLGIDELARSESAILLSHARIETHQSNPLPIPEHLLAGENPGSYLVQSKGAITEGFYQQLEEMGIRVISYIPNNAVLAAMTPEQAAQGEELFESVLPYHPYYKLDSELLQYALGENEKPFRAGTMVQMALVPGKESDFSREARAEGLTILSKSETQFGEVVVVQPQVEQVVTLAQSPYVHLMGVCHPRALANDLTMIRLGVTTNGVNTNTYLDLSGKDVLVNVNDSMVDENHPALKGRVLFAEDSDGKRVVPNDEGEMAHGTHVMGTILGNGAESESVNGGANGSATNGPVSFQGAATNAVALYLPIDSGEPASSRSILNMISWAARTNYLTEKRTNALISNNSWNYNDSPDYDLATALFDGAVRDALPDETGSQPMIFVFSAGNRGFANTEGNGGVSDSILSPATGKNVITVGALESSRHVAIIRTNEVYVTNVVDGVTEVVTNLVTSTNKSHMNGSDDDQQVASYSSRGNVGIGTEGSNGRIKPDVVAPGSFVVSTRGATLKEEVPDTYEEIQYLSGQFLESGETNNYSFFAATNLVGLKIEVLTNASSVLPLPDLGIYIKKGERPSGKDFVGNNLFETNFVMNVDVDVDPEEDPEADDKEKEPVQWSSAYGDWYYSVAGPKSGNASFDIKVTFELLYSQEDKEDLEDLAAANELLGEYYRYDSGTSMAAAAVSGTLALVQEFFATYSPAGVTAPSPALMKALLINGANPAGNQYSRREAYGVNYEGWGLPNMTNMIPSLMTNESDGTWPIWFTDQSTTNALATGEAWEQKIQVPSGMEEGNMKVTLVWTDPAGNPAAAIKLVNDLDLVVSNEVSQTVYVGNDFPLNTDFNAGYHFDTQTQTNAANHSALMKNIEDARDFINNVETIVIKGPLDTNYLLSVQARRVNVNAVTAHTNGIVQDFALVVSFQNQTTEFTTTNKFGIEKPKDGEEILGTNQWIPVVETVTNSVPFMKQRVGASSPLLGSDGVLTNGVSQQWHFYVFTNVWWEKGTNTTEAPEEGEEEDGQANKLEKVRVGGPYVAFSTFLPPNLSSPARLNNADIDMYVSTNSALTNLDLLVIDEAVEQGWASRKQGGSELFYLTNALENEVFYIGIKSEDQKASEYSFVGISSAEPFDENDNGNRIVNFNPGAIWVPDGSSDEPGGALLFGIVTAPITVDNIIVTNIYQPQNAGDLYVSLNHESSSVNNDTVVLHNHSFFGELNDPDHTNEVVIVYDDSEGATLTSQKTDGPGSLRNFMGQDGTGLWLLELTDNALNHTNRVSSHLYITPYYANAWFSVNPFSFLYRSFYVEDDVIAVNITISDMDPELPLELYVRRCTCSASGEQCTEESCYPNRQTYDHMETISPPGRTVTITRDDVPALETGRYWLGVYNPNAVDVDFHLNIEFVRGFTLGDDEGTPSEHTPLELKDDAYTLSQEGFISFVNPDSGETNVVPVVYDSIITVKDDREVKNVNVGVRIDHPRISDLVLSLISPVGTSVLLAENRGWDATNEAPDDIDILPNEFNNSTYGAGTTNDLSKITYAFFSSDTNYTLLPIKFQLPPYTNNGKGMVIFTSVFDDAEPEVFNQTNNILDSGDFRWTLSGSTNTNVVWIGETDLNGDPILPGTTETNLTTVTNFRSWVWDDPDEAFSETNFLIANRTVLKTTFSGLLPHTNYLLRIPFRRPRSLEGMVTWWRANNDYEDTEWNLPLEVAAGFSWPVFNTNGMEGLAFGLTNACLVGRAPNILDSINTNFTVEGWIKVDREQVLSYQDRFGGPNMPLFEFTQLVTNYWTNIVVVDEVEKEEVYEYVDRERGASVWLKGNVWTNNYQRLYPHGTLMVELGKDSVKHETVQTFVNLVEPNANPSTEDYLNTFTNWLHVAISFATDPSGDTLKIYSNGRLMSEQVWNHGYIVPDLSWDYNMGYGNELAYSIYSQQPVYYPGTFTGLMDEFSWYSRALDDEEILDIFDAGNRGKAGMSHPPVSVQAGAEVTLREVGASTNLFKASLPDVLNQWQVGKGRFMTRDLAPEENNSPNYELIIDVTKGAVAFDDIAITTRGQAYEPEVSLANLKGENAKGDWQLLVWDTRAGATNPTPALVSWTLDLGYMGTNVTVIDLNKQNEYTHSGKFKEDEVVYFRVMVPTDVTAATNLLSGNTNMLLAGRWTSIPRFDRSTDDYFWNYSMPPNVEGYVITTNITSQAPLIPGGRYYLALKGQTWRTNESSYKLKVDFGGYQPEEPEGVITLTNQIPYFVDPEVGGGKKSVDYYRFDVATNALAASFVVYDATTNVTMVVSRGLPLPTDQNYAYSVQTRDQGFGQVMIYTNSAPVELTPGTWYVGVYNGGYSATGTFEPVSYKIVATQYTEDIPTPNSLSSGRPVSDVLLPGEIHYYLYRVSADGISLWTEMDQMGGGHLNLYNKYGLPLPGSGNRFYEFDVDPELGLDWWLTKDGTPYPLTPGAWYYAVENTNEFAVDYRLRVTEFSADPSSIIWLKNGIAQTNQVGLIPDGTNSVYYGFDVTTNGVGSLFEVFDRAGGNVSLYSMAGTLPDPSKLLYWYLAAEGNTNAYTRLSAWSGALTPGYWFFTAMNSEIADDLATATNVTYQIRASEFEAPDEEDIVNLINEYPVRVVNSPVYSESYYRYTTGKNPAELIFNVTNVTDMLSVYLLDASPAQGPRLSVYPLNWVGPFGAQIVLNLTNSFVPLVAGDWYVVVENTSLEPVGYDIWAKETGVPEPEQPIDTGFEYDPETGLVTLVWASQMGSVYGVQGTENAFAKPIVWEQFDSVTAVDTITRYPLTREQMEQYVFFSVKLLSSPEPVYDPENITTYVHYDAAAPALDLSWNAKMEGIYYVEGKKAGDTNWVQVATFTNTFGALPTYSTPLPSEYELTRIEPRGGVTPLCVHTSAGYDAGTGELVLSWDAKAGVTYSVRGWTNLSDRVSASIASVTPEGTLGTYRLDPNNASGCSWFSVDYESSVQEEITLGVGYDSALKEIILSWNAVLGAQYRVEGMKGFGTGDWLLIDTVQADATQEEYRVKMSEGYSLFRIVPLGGGSVEPPPVDPDNTPFSSIIAVDTDDSSNVVITVDAKAGDVFTVDYCDDLASGVWSQSGGEYVTEATGLYKITLSRLDQKTKFFRLKRAR